MSETTTSVWSIVIGLAICPAILVGTDLGGMLFSLFGLACVLSGVSGLCQTQRPFSERGI